MREGDALRKGRQVGHRRERDELFRAHYSGVLAFVLSQVHSLERAKEITAGAFAAVLDRRPSAPVPVEPKIALFSHARRSIEVEQKVELFAPLGSGQAGLRVPAHLRRVEDCVRRLGRREQGVISLRFDAGLSCREIGLVMGMNEAEVMLEVLRSLRRIKACMEAAGGGIAPGARRPARPAG